MVDNLSATLFASTHSFKKTKMCRPPDLDFTGTSGNLKSLIISTYFFCE